MRYFLAKAIALMALGMALTSGLAEKSPFITLSSTTSIENSGLLDYLIPRFKDRTGIDVRVVSVGTGRALKLGETGDTDLILVHHRPSEEEFVSKGFGVKRREVMYNDFIIAGPPEDPLDIGEADSVERVLTLIHKHRMPFVSRGDESGTHKKEMELWGLAGVDVQQYSGSWYHETGAGMGTTLNIANGMGAYVLADRGTWLSFKNRNGLALLFENDPLLHNQYSIIEINPERHPHTKFKEAELFTNWLASSEGQQMIASFTLDGQQLFFPNALPQ
ncbi:MAG: sulfate transporter [Proteobacteria bacterium]|nr:sulfate transporter [Pseudomonadota bacterium]